ncbi:hypothetical protein JOD63_000887 [Microbacterium terrae]|uniref:DUF6264 family protein n=1 Tax=Microbacterium terrae TaxID=69369 RepID=UPI0005EC0756|nr:DUF6264 family protein [Microbacterium terrae]MBP1076919.1 hypothetical protein [Microbacterium terrae]
MHAAQAARPADALPTAPRPRPQYGEYATPEEQRARIRQPDPVLQPEPAPAPEPAAPVVAPAVAPSAPAGSAKAAPRVRPVDRIATVALLAYGLVNVISTFSIVRDFPTYAETVFDTMGVDATLTDPGAASSWALVAVIVLIVGWVVTASLSWLSLRRGRLTWWIPVVGGIVFSAIGGVLLAVPIMTDPGVWQAVVAT